ncbi:chaperone protein dnaJ C76, chloroplastic [Neltuma alba]|uniref:chaperone protein dnaJ C76, chloroplastic n=1 Tax=Neltuma alba TaxID=207710 RepID=UPI0010A31B7E|nr:chaperone protein dnaJ C76, chloroplastic-like [Prosopis alba]XP_028786308.1 chaperone protein dnaJ C76, chloroplastic-like [Prosopis alba]
MSAGVVSTCCLLSCSKPSSQVHGYVNFHNSTSRWRQNGTVIKCCTKRASEKPGAQQNYYELLGVSVESNAQEIKEAYRKLQKKYHPDITGQQGHQYTLLLNKAYEVLMSEDQRRKYDESIGQMRLRFAENNSPLGYSTWKGPLRPHALFVDENACIGCGECAHFASNTFIMDEALGSARVKVQYGDDDQSIEVSVESCPVNCIHWVDTEELPVLEFLIQPQPKKGYGVFGGGWERPANVFSAAKAFNKQLTRKEAAGYGHSSGETTVEESPAQAQARAQASMEINMGVFFKLWTWLKETFSINDP